MSSKLAYIIPSHRKVDTLQAAIESALSQTEKSVVIVSTTQEVREGLPKSVTENSNVHIVTTDGDTSYQNLVNGGIETARELEDVEWVSILEHDDRLLPHATKLFTQYREQFSDTQMFAGLTLVVEPADDGPPGLKMMANEAAWAPNLMEELGVFDFNAMLRMNFLFLNGCFIHLDVFDSVGMLKPNMRFYSDYEFVLRVVYGGIEVRSIPKATHYHFVNGEGFKGYQDAPREETSFWVNAARKEYFFEFDREIEYTPAEETEASGA